MPEEKREQPKQSGSDIEAELARLRAEVWSMRGAMPVSVVPEHGAGEGFDVAETWSLAEQEAARAEE
jgi:hypothetical protein